jgi:transcriptional regulator CtsR
MENYFISEYKSYYLLEDSHGYNMTLGGEGMPGYQHTPETKEKMKSADRHKTTGNLHYKHDDTVHHFINRETNEEAFMTQNDFFNTFKFPASAINAIIQGRFTSYKNWHIYGKETKYRVKGQNHHNYNPTTYTLIHKDTGVKISGTLRELVNELKLTHHANLRSVLKGDRQIAYGWMLYK